MPEKIKTLYGSLVEEGYELPNYDQFLKDMSDNNKRTKFHASLVEEGYELPDYKTFSIDMGFDEKKKGFQTDLGSAYATTSGGSFPKYQGMRLEGSTPMTKKGPRQPSSPSNVDKGTFQQAKQKLSKESPIVKIGAYEGALNIVNQRFNQNLEMFNQAKQAGDEQAMAQLQPLLEIDSKKAEGLKKGIDAQKNEAKLKEEDTFGNNVNIGVYQAFGNLLQSPQGLTKAAFTPIMEYGMSLNPIQREVMFKTLAKLDPNMMAMETLGEFGGDVTKYAEERKQMANMNRAYEGSSYNALLEGDIKSAVTYAAKDFANSLPSSATYASGVGAALMSAGMVGDEIRRTEEETGQAVGSKEILSASVKAGLEVVTERLFGDGKVAVDLVKKLGKQGAEEAISSVVKDITKKGLGRKIAQQAGEEVIGESLNQIGANAADIYINGKKDVNLWDGVGDAALIALVGGSTYGGGLTTINHYIDKAKYNKAQAMREEAASLTDQAMDQPNEVAAQALEEKAAEIQADADNIEKKESELAINASTETVDAIMGVETQMDELSVALETATPETAPILEEKLNALEEERVALVEQATLEANEAIKALESVKEGEIIDRSNDIQNRDLFQDGGSFANILGGSGIDSVPTNVQQINGIEFVQFSNPNTGIVDVIMTGTSDRDFVGYYRIYENGKATNKWSSKFENQSRNKDNFKTMISGVQSMLPKGHEYTEKTSISTDGLRVWNQQLSRGYELQYDSNGNIITNRVAINGDAINNELGISVNQGQFDNISVNNQIEFRSVRNALLPYLKRLGLNENNIYWENGTVEIDLPVLRQKTNETITTKEEDVQPMLEGVQTNRDENQAGETSSELRTEQTQEEVVQEKTAEVSPNQADNPNEIKEEVKVSEVESSKEEPAKEEVQESIVEETPALKDVESTTKALESKKDEKSNALKKLVNTVYHATKGKFKDFSSNFLGSNTNANSAKEGFFFASNKDVATSYASKSKDIYDNLLKEKEEAESKVEKAIGMSLAEYNRVISQKYKVDLGNTEEEKTKNIKLIEDANEKLGNFENYKLSYDYEPGLTPNEISEEGDLKEVVLDIKNPFIYDQENKPYNEKTFTGIIKEAKEKGHDGVIIKNTYDGNNAYTREMPTDVYVVFKPNQIKYSNEAISEAYHKAKQDGSNPELVKAVEELLTNKQQEDATQTGKKSESNISEYKGVDKQQQGEQEDRTNKEEPITKTEAEAGGGNQSKQSREVEEKIVEETEGGRRIIRTENIKEKFPTFYERVAKKFSNTAWDSDDIRNAISYLISNKPKFKNGMNQLISAQIEAEKILAELSQESDFITKEELLQKIRSNENYSKEQKDIFEGIVKRLKGNRFFDFTNKNIDSENGYLFAENLLKAKDADAFIHEVGHWGFYNLLSTEERTKYLEYVRDRFYGTGNKMSDDLAIKRKNNILDKVLESNSEDNFSEYFAEQFRQYVIDGLAPKEVRSIFEKFGDYLFEIVKLFKDKGYNKDLKPFFDKIISEKESNIDDIISKLENLKADTKGKMNAFGIIPAIWNAGVDTIILAVKAGKSISESIQEGINYFKENGAKFDEAEVTDFFNKLLSPKKEAPKVEQETPKEEPKKEKVEEPKSKTSKFYKTVFNNKSLEEANKVLTEDDFSYEVKSTKESLKKAKEYVDRVGIEDAYDNFMKNKINELELDEQVALASLLTVIVNMGIQESINQNNEESREFFYDNYRALMLHAQTKFTKLGQAVNAIKLFLESMSSPELAEYKLRKTNQEANEEIKKKPAVKTNASTKVNSGKKTINEGVKTAAEEVAQELNNELYGVITKGKKGLTESQKKNVKAFFNKLKIDTKNAAFSTIIPIPPKLYNDFVEAVGNLVVEGVSVSVAMTQISTEFIKNKIASPDELAQARKILSEEVNGLKEKKPLTEAQKQRNAAREELRKATSEYKEMEKLAKELEKERERVEKLKQEEAKKQSERIDKATNELLAAERKEAEKNAKELEKKIKELSKEISQGKALQDQVEDIINEYLKMGAMDNTANQALIDLVKERLGITDEKQAVDVATKIAKSVVTNIREKLSKKWDADIKRQREKETKEEKVKDPHKEVNDFVKGVALGSMDAEQFIELFRAKYGLETLTEQDFSKVRELATKVRDAETKHRKAKALNDMVQYINSKAPVTLSQLFDELWYFKVLSPALTFFLGTADTNLTYNFTQVYNTIFELPIQQLFTSLRNKAEIGKDKKGLKKAELVFADAIRNIAMGYAKAVIQRGNVKNVDILTKNAFLDVIKTEGFLKDSITYFKEVMTEGSGAFQEYESPFKAGAKTEFEIRRWFKLAKNGDMQAKRDIVNAMLNSGADALNLLVKSVPRSLAAGDLFFSAIIKNAYLPALVREYLIKNTDLRGEALNTEVSRILLNTDIELENAKQKAVENRMRLDIEIKPKMVGDKMTYEIYDKDKLVKGQIFDTKEKANEYARRVVAPKSPMYEMDVTDYLNVKIPAQAMLGANRLAGQAILGGSPPGMSGQLLKGFNYLNDIIGKGTTGLEDVSKSLMLKGEDSNLKYILTPTALTAKTLAVVISGLSRLMAFRRVGIMLARNYSNYVPPIGLLRYGMSYADKSALFIDYLPDQIPSDVERDKMLAQSVLGTFITAMSVTSILALKGLMDDDDDKDERIRKAIKNIQPGTLVGSLSDILTKDQIAAYKASGDIQEFSIFVELDKNGKRKWRSVKPDPKYSSALILATYAWNDIINKDDSGLKSAGLGLASFYNQIKEMGIGQGLPKLSNARSIGEFADIVAQTAFFDNLEITKIGLVTKLTQYLDRKKRLDPHWMDYVEDSDSYLQGTANYVMNEAIPFYNLADAVRQPLSYGALGEEMYRTPSSEQGYISASISYLDSGKNKETRNMYRWLASNGYDKMFYANVTDLKDAEGNEIKLSIFEKNKLGMLAAKASYLELKKKKASLEVIRQTGGTKAFRTEVEKIFRSNFNDVVQLVKKKGFADAVEYERKKNNIEFENKIKKLKADNVKLYGYDKPNSEGEMIYHKGLIEKVKEDISESEGKLVPFEEMDTFGTALKEAKSSDKWNMITSNLNMLKEKYEVNDLRKYIKQLEMLDYLQPELGQDADNYLRGKQPK